MGARARFKDILAGAAILVIAAVGCRQIVGLDGVEYTGDFCKYEIECEDENPCTEDRCEVDEAKCSHSPVADGLISDDQTGNCQALMCQGGEPSVVDFADDFDDGNDCTEDSCTAGGATHAVKAGVVCHSQGGLGVCDAQGECIIKCGFLDADGKEVGCPEAPGACTLSYCDKAQGNCVIEELDGVAVPGTSTGECGGQYCVQGEAKAIHAAADTACPGLSAVNNQKVCSGDGACVDCNSDDQCLPAGIVASFCFIAKCSNHVCANQALDQVDLPQNQQTPMDCKKSVCVQGAVILVNDDSDDSDVADDCVVDSCANGAHVVTPEPTNTPCGVGATTTCDGMGNCTGCNDVADCPDNVPCQAATCINTMCGLTVDPADVVDDGSDCTTDVCNGAVPEHNPKTLGTACGGGGRACDSTGQCLGQACGAGADCPPGAACVDGVCCNTACSSTCEACSTAAKGGVGLNGLCGTVASGMDPLNADCPGAELCDGTTGPAACALPNGQNCLNGADCLSLQCVDGICCNTGCTGVCQACNLTGSEGLCTPIASGQDPQNECPGAVQCNGASGCGIHFPNGAACMLDAECSSAHCVDGMCCNSTCVGACRACNLGGAMNGVCSNMAANADPMDAECPGLTLACDGNGVCKKVNGQTCAMGTECITGQCPSQDGVCCNNACGTLCQACLGAETGGLDGTCAAVTAGTDPEMECPGVTNCGGASTCALAAQGTACTLNGECASGFCVDGVCCNTACNTACKACSTAKTGSANGICGNVTVNTDPDNECATECNGAGACEAANGGACTLASQCQSGNCVDGFCCNSACTSFCQACSAAKTGGANGTCANITMNTDPDNECSGAANCSAGKCTNGATCMSAGDCSSGNCVDGFCCNSACTSLCQACSATKTGGTNGTCSNITMSTDPDNECSGAANCSAGKCTNGATCSSSAECASGNCVDGFCCDTACGGTCQACSAAKTGNVNGICSDILANTDPDNECAGAMVCSIMGTCVP